MANPEFPGIEWLGPCASRFGPYSKRMMVWHCTANTAPAINEAQYALRRDDGVGMHLAADAVRAIQTLQTTMSTGHVGSSIGNRHGISIELVGRIGDSAAQWRPRIDRAVPFARAAMRKHGIPNRWLTIAEMRAGAAGHVTHDMCRIAFGATDHTDPGANFPKQYVVDAIAGSPAAPTPTMGDSDVRFFIARAHGGQLYKCNGMESIPIQPGDLEHLRTLHNEGRVELIGGPGAIRDGWYPGAFGRVDGDVVLQLSDEQLEALAAKVGLSRAELVDAAFEGAQKAEQQ